MTIYSLSKFCFFLGNNRTVVVDDKFTRKCGLNLFLKDVFIMYSFPQERSDVDKIENITTVPHSYCDYAKV